MRKSIREHALAKALAWRDLDVGPVIGSGQAGDVYEARLKTPFEGLPVGAKVAVKRYRSWVLEEPGQVERIIRELHTGRQVAHPSLVRSFAAVADERGAPCLVMEYIPGTTLENRLAELREAKEHYPAEEALRIVAGLAGALSALHRNGIIHRDVKPANVIVNAERAVLMDLGVVRTLDLPEQTTTNAFLGTIRYAAPEYLFGEAYDEGVDHYSLGAITLELFLGRQFIGDTANWAVLVVKKTGTEYWATSELYDLAKRAGFSIADLVATILQLTLAPEYARYLDLAALAAGLDRRCWRRHFLFDRGRLKSSEPSLKVFRSPSPPEVMKASAYADRLRRILSPYRIAQLVELLEVYYWDETLRDDLIPHKALVDAEVLRIESSGTQELDYVWVQPAARYCFRAGLLAPQPIKARPRRRRAP